MVDKPAAAARGMPDIRDMFKRSRPAQAPAPPPTAAGLVDVADDDDVICIDNKP